MGTFGKLIVLERLKSLEEALQNYFGALNELKMGMPGLKVTIPEKPEALVIYEEMQKLHQPLVAGGIIDQPHIWLQELAIVITQQELFTVLSEVAAPSAP